MKKKRAMPISSNVRNLSREFYYFTGIHSLLIGLFLFYVPVYIWKQGADLAGISLFIALIGFSFCGTLWFWDRLGKRAAFNKIIAASFLIEAVALSVVFLSGSLFFMFCFALMLGVYNCFFWISQRCLFVAMISPDNSGRRFGDFQIYVVIILKIGVFAGGILLEKYGFLVLYFLSVLFALCGAVYFGFLAKPTVFAGIIDKSSPLSHLDIRRFRDDLHSKIIFAVDGFFLYLESYFWLISLFLLVKKSFLHLGLLVIFLAVVFGVLFFFIKNKIDRADKQKVYLLAVLLYMAGWYLRGFVRDDMENSVLYPMLVCITFCTSFFRLAFNKRFFDHAKEAGGIRYILVKSYYSQFFLGIIFSGLAWCYSLLSSAQVSQTLGYTYFAAGGLTLLYLLYPPKHEHGGAENNPL